MVKAETKTDAEVCERDGGGGSDQSDGAKALRSSQIRDTYEGRDAGDGRK
jgi:hypothetical protein